MKRKTKDYMIIDCHTGVWSFLALSHHLKYHVDNGWEGIEVSTTDVYDNSLIFKLYKERMETDSEYDTRIKNEELTRLRDKKSKEYRLAQYKLLRREFENDT